MKRSVFVFISLIISNLCLAQIARDNKINNTFLQRVHHALQQKGFAQGEYVNQRTLQDNLANFQKFHNLAVGAFSVESMQKLGIAF